MFMGRLVTGSMPAGLAMGVTRLALVWGRPPEPSGLLYGAVVEVPVVGALIGDASVFLTDLGAARGGLAELWPASSPTWACC